MTGLFKRFVVMGVAALVGASGLPAQDSRGIVSFTVPSTKAGAKPEMLQLYAKSYALVIGIDSYNDRDWRRLKEARNDADAVAKTLEAHGFKVTLHKDLKSTELKREVEHFLITTGNDPEARLFIWFAGHGHTLQHGASHEGYLVPADAPGAGTVDQPNPAFELAALPMTNFNFWMTRSRAKHVLAVFDSCFSGLALAITRSIDLQAPALISRETAGKARQIISSGDADEKVADNGRFREIFINAITGKAGIGGRGYLTGRELGTHLRQEMVRATANSAYKQRPNDGYVDRAGFRDGDFVFEVIKPDGTRLSPPPPPVSAPTVVKTPRPRPVGPDPSTEARLAWERAEKSNDRGQIAAWRRQFGTTNPYYDELAAAMLAKLEADAKAKADEIAKAKPPPPKVAAVAPGVAAPSVAIAPVAPTPAAPAPVRPAPLPARSAPAKARDIDLCQLIVKDPIEGAAVALAPFVALKETRAGPQDAIMPFILAGRAEQLRTGCTALAASSPSADARADASLIATAAAQFWVVMEATGGGPASEQTVLKNLTAFRPQVLALADKGHANSRAALTAIDYVLANDFTEPARKAFAAKLAASASLWGRLVAVVAKRDDTAQDLTAEELAELRSLAGAAPPTVKAALALAFRKLSTDKPEYKPDADVLLKSAADQSYLGQLAHAIALMEFDKNAEAAVKIVRSVAEKGGVIENLAIVALIGGLGDGPPQWKDLVKTEANLVSSALDKIAAADDPYLTFLAVEIAASSKDMKELVGSGRIAQWLRQVGETGDAATMFSLAAIYAAGSEAVAKNEAEANRLLRAAAEQTKDPMLLWLAVDIASERADKVALMKRAAATAGPSQLIAFAGADPSLPDDAFDMKERAAMVRRAAEQGDADVGLRVIKVFTISLLGGGDLEAGKVVQKQILLAAAAKGTTEQILKVAEVFVSGDENAVRDPIEAARLFKIVSEKTTDKKLQLDLARRFALGRDIAPNRDEASRLYRSAAEGGDPETALEVALAFGKGEGVYINPADAAKWLKVAATSKVPLTLIAVADAFGDGKIVPKDTAAAARALQAAGEAGSPAQKLVVARQFLSGALKDETEGLKFLRAAADAGQVDALEQLADMTERGVLVAANAATAADLALRAVKSRQRVTDATFETWRTAYSVDFRRAMQTTLKTAKHYTGSIDGVFGAGMKRALDAYVK